MRAWLALAWVCLCAAACSGEGGARRGERETYEYLVTPHGERFRLVVAGPVLRGANTQLGVRITYLVQTTRPEQLITHADALVRALGPELQLTGETRLTVRARLGPPSLALRGADKARFDLAYTLQGGKFVRAEDGSEPPPLAGAQVPDDPTFPFRPALLNKAAREAVAWLDLLDGRDLGVLRAGMTQALRDKLGDDAQFRQLLTERSNAGLGRTRRENYRLQLRSRDKSRAPGDDARVVYESTAPNGARVVERVVLARDGGTWRVSGYAFQPVPR